MSETDDIKVIIDFSEQFNIEDLGSITQSTIVTVFDEEDFLAYAAAPVQKN